MYLLAKSDVPRFLSALSARFEMYGPQVHPVSGDVFFDKAADSSSIRLDAPIPANSPKFAVFPHWERILSYAYDRETKDLRIVPEDLVRPKALVGIRSCDLTGLLCFDRFFLGQEFVDEFYRAHRRRMFLVSVTCVTPFAQCFCVCTDSGPAAREGYDVNLTDLGEAYLFEAGSDAGRELPDGRETLGIGIAPALRDIVEYP